MPTDSPHSPITIPNVDLWGLMFENNERESFPKDKVIYRSLEPDRLYCYEQVQTAATEFGRALKNLWNWQKADVLTIFSPNDVDFGPLVFGVFHAGGIVSPANPAYSARELGHMLKDSRTKAIATTVAFIPVVREAALEAGIPLSRVILIGNRKNVASGYEHWASMRERAKSLKPAPVNREKIEPAKDLAFLVYSSGTTGLPKGVMLSHKNVVADLLMINGAMGRYYNWRNDKFLGVLPFFHIYGLTGLVQQPLLRGIELVVMPAFDLRTFCATIQDLRITFVYVAPPVLVRLARDPLVTKYDLRSLRMITSGAAPLTRELVETVNRRIGVKINQAYGLSETSPMTHTQPWEEWHSSVGSIGKLFPNMKAKIVGDDGHEIEVGKPGEMWLSGANVFLGYLNNGPATREAITEDGWFRTGDVGFVDAKGDFYITDRLKELIKYKGFQVAPAELEGLLMDNEDVNDVAVIGVELREEHTEVPRAYIVLAESCKPDEATATRIVNWMDAKVAKHKKLRGGVRFVQEIPKSAAGKILRRVLKDIAKKEEAEQSGKDRHSSSKL